jgi:predicted AAA+ superfamily ATPase
MDDDLFRRLAGDPLMAALRDTPVVMVVGPRQCGKTTLVRDLVGAHRTYLTLDDQTVLQSAREDPTGFVRGRDQVTIDEVQRAPDLLPAIKQSVDRERRPGRFLLTGSADVLTLPTVSESLAGRLEVVPRRSPRLTHFCSREMTHAEITI